MKIREINERKLIKHISGLLSQKGRGTVVGAGEDDCAVIELEGDNYLLSTTDMLHQKTDFPPRMSGWQIGWMSAAVNLSDLASKGAKPLGLLMAVGISPDEELEFLDEILRGMDDCAVSYGTHIIGGDMDSHSELTIAGTALGLVRKDRLLRRSGAMAGDLVCVTGYTGTAGAALILLNRGVDPGANVTKALFEPEPRIKEGIALAESGAVTSMIDTSDGLSLSLHDLRDAGKRGFMIFEDTLPVHPEVKKLLKDDELYEAAVFTGGDFELLFTVRSDMINKAKNSCSFTIIGEVAGEDVLIKRKSGIEELKSRGYEHF